MSKIAVIFAAGIGIRLQPLTITQHKSLILLKTKPLIEVIITYLLLNPAIVEIIVITGYQQEKFAYLPKKYPKVTNIYNRYYLTKKSAFVLRLIRTKLQGKHSLYFISGDFVMKSNCFLTNITSNVMAAMRKPATLVAN